MNSGGAVSVAAAAALPQETFSPSTISASDQTYLIANGTKLAILETIFMEITNRHATTQDVVSVHWIASSRDCDIRSLVVFRRDGGWVDNQWTGQRTCQQRRWHLYECTDLSASDFFFESRSGKKVKSSQQPIRRSERTDHISPNRSAKSGVEPSTQQEPSGTGTSEGSPAGDWKAFLTNGVAT